MIRNIAILISCILALSCSRNQEPSPVTGAPEFSVNALFDGEAIQVAAGVDGYFMSTSAFTDQVGQSWYEGTLANLENPGDHPAFGFQFRDVSEPGDPKDVSSTLSPGNILPSNLDTAKLFQILFDAEPWTAQGQIDQVLWEFEDGTTSEGMIVEKSFDYKDQYHLIKATMTSSEGCQRSQEYRINPWLPGNIGVEIIELDNNNFVLQAATNGFQAESFGWTFERGLSGTGSQFMVQGTPGVDIERVCLEVQDMDGNQYYHCTDLVYNSNVGCALAFTFNSEFEQTVSNGKPGQRVLELNLNLNGDEWKAQTGIGSLEIISSSPFQVNDFGKPTQKILLNGNFVLRNKLGVQKDLQIIEAIIAVATSE